MPELPEVETVRRTLEPALGQRVTGVWTSGLPLRMARPVDKVGLVRAASGAVFSGVRRHGKYLMLDFVGRLELVLVHLGMTGRLRLIGASLPIEPHTHVIFALDGPHQIRFSDPRRFGLVAVAPGAGREREHPALAQLGPDPLVDRFGGAELYRVTCTSRQMVKTLLLDQRVVAGVGNIYASEALWLARILPTTRSHRLARARVERLARAVSSALHRALERGGTSLRDFVDATGKEGNNAEYLRVYDRAKQRCLRRGCGGRIRRTVIQGRATFFCPRCQLR